MADERNLDVAAGVRADEVADLAVHQADPKGGVLIGLLLPYKPVAPVSPIVPPDPGHFSRMGDGSV